MPDAKWNRGEVIGRFLRLIWPAGLSFLPALALAWQWYGAQGAMVVAAGGLPLAWLCARSAASLASAGRVAQARPASGLMPRDAILHCLDESYRTIDHGKVFGCLVVQIDEATRIEQTYGRAASETAARKVAERLQGVVREKDFVHPLDGGRFALTLAPGRRMDLEAAVQIAARAQVAVTEPLSIDALTIYLTASIGFCLSTRAPQPTGAALLAAAELALDDAVRHGPGAIRAYSADIADAACAREALADSIAHALEAGEIVAYFQPQLCTDTGAVVGFEALARWLHPQRGILSPAEFLPAILSSGLSERLSEVMLAHTLRALRGWDKAALGIPGVSMNFSGVELRNPNLAAKLKWELDRFDIAPERLHVEILETVIAEREHDVIVHNIAELARLGCGIDLDDFGTGFASLASLRRFAVDRIKIDRSYITRVDSDAGQQRMVSAVLSMAERLGLTTLAEGVETLGEHAILSQLGCMQVQGYGIARPMPVEATEAWIRKHQRKLTLTPGFTQQKNG